jgi:hypothetical protein
MRCALFSSNCGGNGAGHGRSFKSPKQPARRRLQIYSNAHVHAGRLADAEWLENARLIGIRSDTAPKNAVPRNGWTVRRILKTRAAADE